MDAWHNERNKNSPFRSAHRAVAARHGALVQGRDTRAGGSGLRGPRRCSRPPPGSEGQLPLQVDGRQGPGVLGVAAAGPAQGGPAPPGKVRVWVRSSGPKRAAWPPGSPAVATPLSSSTGSLTHPRRLVEHVAPWIRPLQQPWGVAAKTPRSAWTETRRVLGPTPKRGITRRGTMPRVPRVPRLQT